MLRESQIPPIFREIIDAELELYNEGRTVQVVSSVPDTTEIPIVKPRHWLKIPDVVCVFADMKGSTILSASAYDQSTAGAYQLFTGTAVKLFDAFEAPYIDVKGDGVFALFNSNQVHRALAAAVTFRTFASEVFKPVINEKTKLDIGCHIGIDQKTVLVRKLGLKRVDGRTDRQNEVWAGKPVNMASKLASLGEDKQILVSDRYFRNLKADQALQSCGHTEDGNYTGEKKSLWKERLVTEITNASIFDFDLFYQLSSKWCIHHGEEFCEALLRADKD